MSEQQSLLTIAIPTYNRAECLDELLTFLAPQLGCAPQVELLISDNASTDSTAEVVRRFQAAGLVVNYLRNHTNLGMDGNFLQCFEQASGNYVWLIGDDDVLVPGGLEAILGLLAPRHHDLVYVSSYSFKGNYQPHLQRAGLGPQTFPNALDFVRKVNVALTFLSGTIIHKDRLLSLDHHPFASLDGTKLVQLGWIYTMLRHYRSGLVIHQPLIAARAENTGGYAVFQVFGISLRRITEEWLVDPAMVRVMLNSTVHFFLPWFLLKMKSMDHTFEQEDPHFILKSAFRDRYQYWLFNYPIITLPRHFAKAWFFFGKLLLKVDGYLGSPLFG